MIKLEVVTDIFPSEDEEIIKKALMNLFPFENFESKEVGNRRKIRGIATGPRSVEFIYRQVRRQRTVEAMRHRAFKCMDIEENSLELMINKQALTQSFVVICTTPAESPLGPVYLNLSASDIEALVEYLFPKTEKGKVLEARFSIANL